MIKDDGIDGVKTVHKGCVCNFGGQLVRSFSRSNAVDCSTTTVKNFHVQLSCATVDLASDDPTSFTAHPANAQHAFARKSLASRFIDPPL